MCTSKCTCVCASGIHSVHTHITTLYVAGIHGVYVCTVVYVDGVHNVYSKICRAAYFGSVQCMMYQGMYSCVYWQCI